MQLNIHIHIYAILNYMQYTNTIYIHIMQRTTQLHIHATGNTLKLHVKHTQILKNRANNYILNMKLI